MFGYGSYVKWLCLFNFFLKFKWGVICILKFVCLVFKEEVDCFLLLVKEWIVFVNVGLGDVSIIFEINKSFVYNGIIERFF